jgi:asparagine synthase (glutamine-hydrolysing)
MCGIAVIANSNRNPRDVLARLDVMHGDLASRGPDGEGVLLVDRDLRPYRFDSMPAAISQPPVHLSIAAAFRRLAVRDLRPEAGLPLAMSQGRRWILHNGELYNDADLRRELAALGASFATTNDAETILAAYAFWGEACFERLRGMWAVVIVDLEQGRLIASRDRLGIKPLFYAEADGGLLLASHPRTIARALGPTLDRRRWHRFLRGVPADTPRETFFAGVRAVPAGAIASIDLRAPATTVRTRQFWSLDGCVAVDDDKSDANRSDELLALLEAATREQLQSDRKIGCLLSGGLDSSLVACLAARAPDVGRLTCLSIVFDDPRMSEWPYIRMAAASAGAESVCHRLTTDEVWGLTDDVILAHGEPLLGQDAIAHYRAGLSTRQGA